MSCNCDDYSDWYAEPGEDILPLDSEHTRRCQSCRKQIRPGDMCLRFDCWRYPETDEEIDQYDEDGKVPLPDEYLCEDCGEIYMNLTDLGYCIGLGADMCEALQDYQDMTGFDPAKYQEATP